MPASQYDTRSNSCWEGESRCYLTDSKCLLDALTSNKGTAEGKIMLDIFAAEQGYSRREIDNIGLIRIEVNLADDVR